MYTTGRVRGRVHGPCTRKFTELCTAVYMARVYGCILAVYTALYMARRRPCNSGVRVCVCTRP